MEMNGNRFGIEYISSGARAVPAAWADGQTESLLFANEYLCNGKRLREFYRHMLETVLIFDPDEAVFKHCDQKNREAIASVSSQYKYIDRADFIKKFYA